MFGNSALSDLGAYPPTRGGSVMIDRSSRLQLASLGDEEIVSLIDAIPGLAASWASLIGTDIECVRTGQIPVPAVLRAAAVMQNDRLTAALARIGLEIILNALDSVENGEGADEGPIELAVAAGRQFGSIGSKWFLCAVAAGDDPLAREVADRLAELQDVAAENGRRSTATSSRRGDTEMSNHGEAIASPGPAFGSADIPVLSALLARTKELQETRMGAAPLR